MRDFPYGAVLLIAVLVLAVLMRPPVILGMLRIITGTTLKKISILRSLKAQLYSYFLFLLPELFIGKINILFES